MLFYTIFQYSSADLLLVPNFTSLRNGNCSGSSVLKEAVPRRLESYCIISLCTNSRICILNALFIGFEITVLYCLPCLKLQYCLP